jgi:hypothetical protein
MGILGATLHCSRYWALDMDQAEKDQKLLPTIFDFIGYVTMIIGGGVTGLILYFMVLITHKAVFIEPTKMRFEAAIIISFCGGLFHFKVRDILEEFYNSIIKQKKTPSDGKANN